MADFWRGSGDKSKRQKREEGSVEDSRGTKSVPHRGLCDAEGKGREWTVSIAVSASVLDVAQSVQLATTLVGQLGRAAAIFCVDEIIVFQEPSIRTEPIRNGSGGGGGRGGGGGMGKKNGDAAAKMTLDANFAARILEYLETPQYLRRTLVPYHTDLMKVGQCPPLDMPHHPRQTEWSEYREGVAVDGQKNGKVNVGLDEPVSVKGGRAPQHMRVTVRMEPGNTSGCLVPPYEPRKRAGLYWGYSTRVAPSLHEAIHGGEGPYDLVIGTSENGQPLEQVDHLPTFQRALIVFGGPRGLEPIMGEKEPQSIFHTYVNTCAGQGSRTIRTEEALLISLSGLQGLLRAAGKA